MSDDRVLRTSGAGVIVFRVTKGTGSRTAAGTEAKFVFHNGASSTVRLPGYFGKPPSGGQFQPTLVEYDVGVGGEWRPLDVGYDGLPEYYTVDPKSTITLLISLGPLEKQGVKKDAPVRIRIGEFVSETFTLEDVFKDTVMRP